MTKETRYLFARQTIRRVERIVQLYGKPRDLGKLIPQSGNSGGFSGASRDATKNLVQDRFLTERNPEETHR